MARPSLVLLALAVASARAQFGGTCDGGTVPDVAALQNQYPAIGAIADIVPGDTVATQLFQSINGSALSFAPSTLVAGYPSFQGYNAGADPACWWTATTCKATKVQGLPADASTCTTPSTWGLSFDDGPTCAHAPLYNLLRQNNQQATLFYIGGNVASFPNEARLGYAQGHEICVHTWSHHYTTSLTNSQVFAELYYTKKIIKQVTGVTPRCWRPPYGDVDDRLRTIALALELYTYIWDNDTNDWAGAGTGNADYASILNGNYQQHGTMVLSHEVSDVTVNLFLQHWPLINGAFRHVMSSGTCMNITAPYAEQGTPLTQNVQQYLAGPTLATLQAPTTANASDLPLFAGQAAFLASLQGNNLVPVVSSSSSAVPSSTSASAANSASSAVPAVPTNAFTTNQGNKVQTGVIAGAVGGAVGAAVLLALLLFCCRRRGWLCFGEGRRSKHAIYGEDRTPSGAYDEKFNASHSSHALLGTPLNKLGASSTRESGLSSAFVSHSDLNSSRYPSQSELRAPGSPGFMPGGTYHDDFTPPASPRLAESPRSELPPGAGMPARPSMAGSRENSGYFRGAQPARRESSGPMPASPGYAPVRMS